MVVVAIDERTRAHLGLSALPREWPRSIHARLIERLLERGASVIVFDLDFSRPKAPEDDLAFANAIAAGDRVVLVEKLSGKRQPVTDRNGRHQGFVWVEQVIPPMSILAEAAKGLGPFSVPKMEVAVHEFWAFKPSLGDAPTMPAVALQIQALGAYERWLQLLSSVFDLMSQVVRGTHRSVHAAYQASEEEIGVSLSSVYNKLNGLEASTSAELVRYGAGEAAPLIEGRTAGLGLLHRGGNLRHLPRHDDRDPPRRVGRLSPIDTKSNGRMADFPSRKSQTIGDSQTPSWP